MSKRIRSMSKIKKELQEKADKKEQEIIDVLKSQKSFIVEAGAGSGKTYSLMKVIDWLEENRGIELKNKKQNIACITYTNAAVNVILSRLPQNSAVIPCTIHSFAWRSISQYQESLLQYVKELNMIPKNYDASSINIINYTLGSKYVEKGTLYLYHDDVIKLYAKFLDNSKFRRIFSSKYPIILIDEYQDSSKMITEQFIKHFIDIESNVQFCFFGDSWQTIYSKDVCGKIESNNLIKISKEINFRSNKVIIDLLNIIRPNLPQIAVEQKNDGEFIIITTDDYKKGRQTGYCSGELQPDDLVEYISNVKNKLEKKWNGSVKTLMLTHKLLANQQGYKNVLKIFDKHFTDEDLYLSFFEKIVEPLYNALETNNINSLYDVIKNHRNPIETKKQKKLWYQLKSELAAAREKNVSDVISVCIKYSKILPINLKIKEIDDNVKQNNQYEYRTIKINDLYQINYLEIINAIKFRSLNSDFSTEHSVKGEEYENVLYVIGRGWNNYKFDEQIYLNPKYLSDKDLETYIRNRNLFYVCCSRPKKRLAILVTVPINDDFRNYLKKLASNKNIISYSLFI